MDWTPIALLLTALALFLISTLQFTLWLRFAIIVAGVVSLASCAALVLALNSYGLLNALGDLWTHHANLQDSVIGVALASDVGVVTRHVSPLLQMLVFLAALLCAFSLIALTPGERTEAVVRTTIVVLLGVMLGATLALTLVVLGMGGPVKQRSYVAEMSAHDVHDGDTIWMNDVSLRLAGIDAPELREVCSNGDHCGEAARDALARLVNGRIVQCTTLPQKVDGRPQESFGRPLANCFVRDGDRPGNLGDQMVAAGFAIPYADHGPIAQPPAGTYLAARCFLRPYAWRNETSERHSFEAGDLSHVQPQNLGGFCARSASSDSPR